MSTSLETLTNVALRGGIANPVLGGVQNIYLGRSSFTIEPWRSTPRFSPDELQDQPSRLLDARQQVIRFSGRTRETRMLTRWRNSGRRFSVAVVYGPGGQGKTRLANHFAASSIHSGWAIGQAFQRTEVTYPTARDPDRVASDGDLLMLVDYADRWSYPDLKNLLIDARLRTQARTRVLLLARSVAWLPAIRDVLTERGVAATELALDALARSHARIRRWVYDTACAQFAAVLNAPAPIGSNPPGDFLDRAYDQVLALHMAALVAVDRALADDRGQTAPDLPDSPEGLSAYLLDREHRHWGELYAQNGRSEFRTPPRTMSRTVLIATLAGPTNNRAATRLLHHVGLPDTQQIPSQQILDDHRVCYPPVNRATMLEPLYPDRLAEDYLALILPGHDALGYQPDPWAADIPTDLLIPHQDGEWPAYASRAIITLSAAAERWSHLIPTLEAVEPHLPEGPDIALDIAAADLALRLTSHRLTTVTDPAEQARLHALLAMRLANAGRRAETLNHAEKAVSLRRRLVGGVNGAAYLHELADSLDSYAVVLLQSGRHAEALRLSVEAVSLRRELVDQDRDEFLPDLAGSLTNHSNQLAQAGNRTEATALAMEAVTLYRELATSDRAKFLPDLAGALNNGALRSAESELWAEALTYTTEAVTLFRELASHNRRRFLPDLAMAVGNHAAALAKAGDPAAVRLSEEAVALGRQLVDLNRDAYLPDLATAVGNHALWLGEAGRRAEALRLSAEAVSLRRQLVDLNRDAYLPDLAMAVGNHAVTLAEAGDPAALRLSEEAVGLRRQLVDLNRDAYLPGLAKALWGFASVRVQIGIELDIAFHAVRESTHLYRRLVEQIPEAFTGDMRGAYATLADVLSNQGHNDEAQEIRQALHRGANRSG